MKYNFEDKEKILALIHSEDATNAELGVQLLKGKGIWEDFIVQYYLHSDYLHANFSEFYEEKEHQEAWKWSKGLRYMFNTYGISSDYGFTSKKVTEKSIMRNVHKLEKQGYFNAEKLINAIAQYHQKGDGYFLIYGTSEKKKEILQKRLKKTWWGAWEMNLSNLGLFRLPIELYTFKDIAILNLVGNRLERIPRKMIELPKLRVIKVKGNRMKRGVHEDVHKKNVKFSF